MGLINATGLWDVAAYGSTAGFSAGRPGELSIAVADRGVLRGLAERVAAHAARPAEKEKRDLWRRHDDLEATRPVVFCDPENGWNEIITAEDLQCRHSLARRWELVLRKELFWAERLRDDKVIEPVFDIGYTHGEDDWGFRVRQRGGQGGAYAWEPALKDEGDIGRIHAPVFAIDRQTTGETIALAEQTLGDLLQVRLRGEWWWSFGLTFDLALLRGLEQVMLDMVERPELVHRLMGLLRDGYLQKLDALEAGGLLTPNNDRYVGSGGFGYTRDLPAGEAGRPATTRQMWGFCESQETAGISPEMFAELIFPYQLPFLERFGLNCYGCCEPLDRRWPIVRNTPNLRRVSVSPWADPAKMASFLEDRYVFSMKLPPADLAGPRIDEERIRRKIRDILEVTRGCRVELIMKDNHTIGRNPGNVIRWARIAREEADRSSGG